MHGRGPCKVNWTYSPICLHSTRQLATLQNPAPVLSLRLHGSKISLPHYLSFGCALVSFDKQNAFICEMNKRLSSVDGKGSADYILETLAYVDSGLNH